MYHDTGNISFLGRKIWEILPDSFKKIEIVEAFGRQLEHGSLKNCPCRLCRGICSKYWFSMNNHALYRLRTSKDEAIFDSMYNVILMAY